ncbi:hypothetical protein BJ741DRAFT_595577 [Chytriomyces cf. hyalinus JEL632]|nr:hypothetical protein BJ741DRAFT_595577 [Chytriomyces cf. hyalinus JEL632]
MCCTQNPSNDIPLAFTNFQSYTDALAHNRSDAISHPQATLPHPVQYIPTAASTPAPPASFCGAGGIDLLSGDSESVTPTFDITPSPTLKSTSSSPPTTPAFLNNQHIHQHHQRRKAFKCPWDGCVKEYVEMRNLRAHYLTHSSTPQHVCSVCSASFVRQRDLQRHGNSVHNTLAKAARQFQCVECSLSFSRRDSLLRHLKVSHRL